MSSNLKNAGHTGRGSELESTAPSVHGPIVTKAFVGRQPIFDQALNVSGYELLFRPGDVDEAGQIDSNQATSRLLLNTFVEIGLERIVGGHRAFINFTNDFLLDDNPLPLPQARVVLEIIEGITIDAALIQAVSSLADQGYTIALDDFVYHPRWEPLIALADIIKIDVRALATPKIEEHVRFLRPRRVKLLAEKIETREEFDLYRQMGFDYFQGYFFSRPKVIAGKRLLDSRLAVLRLLTRLHDPQIDLDEIATLLSQDVSLSYKLLRYLNSAFFALPKEMTSIRQAVVYLGLQPLKRWATLIAMAGIEDKPPELMHTALVRARMCELLCKKAGRRNNDAYFTAGLFSNLDALMDAPMREVLEQLPLSEELTLALLDHTGPLGETLHCVLAYEHCEWTKVSLGDLDWMVIREAYAQATEWSFGASAGLMVPEGRKGRKVGIR